MSKSLNPLSRYSCQQCTADHPAGKHLICPHLEAEMERLQDQLAALRHALTRDNLARVLTEAFDFDDHHPKKWERQADKILAIPEVRAVNET